MKQIKNHSVKVSFSAVMLGVALLISASLALAQTGAKVYPQPVAADNEMLTIDLMVENVADLYGVEFRLKYDPSVVAIQDANPQQEGLQIEAGNFLPVEQGFVVANAVNEADGTISFAMTLLNPAPPVSGTGPLARLTLNMLQNTPSMLEVEDVKLVSVSLQTIPTEITPLSIGADETAAVAITSGSSDFPWWIVAAGIMVLGLTGLGIFMAMGGLNKAQPQTKPVR